MPENIMEKHAINKQDEHIKMYRELYETGTLDLKRAIMTLKNFAITSKTFCKEILKIESSGETFVDYENDLDNNDINDEEHWTFNESELDEAFNSEMEFYLVKFTNKNGKLEYRFCKTGEWSKEEHDDYS